MISKVSLNFLKSLKKNNQRDWFNAHKEKYESAKTEFEIFIEKAIREISRFDKDISGIKAGECIFRIYRDVRFSKDKSPYKTHLGAFITYNGKNSNGPGYYIHIEPGNCFLAGGIYHPPGEQLALVRKEIDFSLKYFKRILKHEEFQKYFGELSDMGKLQTTPKGFAKDHPALDYLKHKSFIVSHKVKDEQVCSEYFPAYSLKVFRAMRPLNKFLNTALD